MAALAPEGQLDLAASFSAASSRAALVATRNTIEVGIASSIGALVLGAGFATALAVTDVRGKRVLALLYVTVAAGRPAGRGARVQDLGGTGVSRS